MSVNKKRGLGNRGLDVLLGDLTAAEQEQPSFQAGSGEASTVGENNQLKTISIECIQRSSFQPRRHFDQETLQELADSIRQQGILQPIVVRPLKDGRHYELIAGERRWRASQLAGLDSIPALIREADDTAVAAMAIIENIQRENLNSVEQAMALQRLLLEFDMTHQQVADSIGRSRALVTNLLRILSLNEEVKQLLSEGKLELGHAKVLLALERSMQLKAAREVIDKQLSVRQTEALVRQLNTPAKTKMDKPLDPNIVQLEQSISEKLGAKVKIQHGEQGAGKLVIQYHSLDELDGILVHLA